MTAPTLAPTGCADVIDLERYPIHDLASTSGRELVARCRGDLADHGAAVLHGFVTPAAVAAMVTVAGELAESAWGMEQTHTVYFEPNDAEVDAAHPRARQIRSAKHGIAGLTKTVALELAEHGVTCNAISPGFVWTPLVEKQIPDLAKSEGISEAEAKKKVLSRQPTRQFVTVDQVAALAVFLATEAAAPITGSNYSIDGGWTAE